MADTTTRSALTTHEWLAPLKGVPAFDAAVNAALDGHLQAVELYGASDGPAVLGVPARPQVA